MLAFPTAEGFGRNSIGGRGGQVLQVTKLTDDGSVGTLRWACNQNFPRTVVFRVGGVIPLTSNLTIPYPYITIAGQTAPGGGILVKNASFHPLSHNAIIRFMRFRVGTDLYGSSAAGYHDTNGLSIYGNNPSVTASDIILDHCSVSWSNDQNLDAYGNCANITMQYCVSTEGMLFNPTNNSQGHCMGGLIGSQPWYGTNLTCSVYRCLYAHNVGRNPLGLIYVRRASDGTVMHGQIVMLLDLRNSVVYNQGASGGNTSIGAIFDSYAQRDAWIAAFGANAVAVQSNWVNNHFIKGPYYDIPQNTIAVGTANIGSRLYAAGNITFRSNGLPADGVDTLGLGKGEGISRDSGPVPAEYKYWGDAGYDANQFRSLTEFVVPPMTTQPASLVKETVLRNAGCHAVVRNGVVVSIRDAVDVRIMGTTAGVGGEVRNLTGLIGNGIYLSDYQNGARYTYPTIGSGTPYPDSNNDGIEDGWAGMPAGATANQVAPNGYTYLENFLNEMAGDTIPVVPTDTTPPLPPTGLNIA